MAEVKFFKVNALPDVLVADAFYYVQNGDYAESYLTTVDGVARKVGNSEMIGELIELAIAGKQNQLVAGTGITIDVTDPDNPVISSSGGGSAGVSSFNSRTGLVTLSFSDVTAALAYTPVTPSELSAVSGAIPTSPADIGAATAAQGGKADSAVQPAELATAIAGTATAAQGAKADTAVQPDALSSGLAAKVDIVPGKQLSTEDYTTADKTKLAGVASGATANSPNATLLARANHTGTQLAATISDFASTVLGSALTGLSLVTGTPVVAADSILAAIGKLQKQISDIASAALSNPMSALGDLIYGGASGSPTRLAAGQEGANLRVYNGLPSYLPNYKAWQSLRPANATTGGAPSGIIISAIGTVSHPTQDLTSKLSATRRIRFTGAATAAASCGFYETSYTKSRGNAPGLGGFHFEETFGQASNFTGQRAFIGLSKTMSQLAVDPSTLFNIVCVGYDAADLDSGNWQLMCNDASGAATKIDLPLAPRNATDLYRLTIHCDANDSGFSVRFENLSTGVLAYNDKLTTNIPVATEFLNLKFNLQNGAVAQSSIIEHANYDAGIQD